MKAFHRLLRAPAVFLSLLGFGRGLAHAADLAFEVEVRNHLDRPRSRETIELSWPQVERRLPKVQPDQVVVSTDGQPIPAQVAATSSDGGAALIFQADFGPNQNRRFTVSAGDAASIASPRTYAVFVAHPTLDYMAWENDRIAFRLYGPECEKTLVSSGVDVWVKHVERPVIEMMRTRNYHEDLGDGVDCYTVGNGRGCGGLGVWVGDKLHVSRNFKTWKILANGPLRTVIELEYSPWDAGGVMVSETKRITLDAGSQLNKIESTLRSSGNVSVTAAIGLGVPKSAGVNLGSDARWAAVWQDTAGNNNGQLGIAFVKSPGLIGDIKQVGDSVLLCLPALSGQPVVYYAGAGWSKREYPDAAAWSTYLDEFVPHVGSHLETMW